MVTDFEADEEAMLRRALQESAREAGLEGNEDEELERVLRESAMEADLHDGEETEGSEDGEEIRSIDHRRDSESRAMTPDVPVDFGGRVIPEMAGEAASVVL